MDYNDAASAEGKTLHPFWNYMSVFLRKRKYSILKSSSQQYQFRTSLPADLEGNSFVAKRDLFLKRVVFTVATVSLIISYGSPTSYSTICQKGE